MALAFCPHDRPPRLVRFTHLPDTVLARYDEEQNLLLVDRALYATLSKEEQNMLLRTQREGLHHYYPTR